MSAASAQPAICVRSVTRVFDTGVRALGPIDLEVARGEFLALLGPSGCGKSTLLRLIAGLDQPSTGEVHVPGGRDKVAYVFQDPHLMPWRTVLRNVALPLELRGQRPDAAMHAIEQVGLAEAAHRYPAQLSGGMRMRVSLARALVTQPDLLLMDEPFAALDEITRNALDERLLALWSQHRMTVVFVTHSVGEAAFLAQRAAVMSPRPGRIVGERGIALSPERDAALRTEDPRFVRACSELVTLLRQSTEAAA